MLLLYVLGPDCFHQKRPASTPQDRFNVCEQRNGEPFENGRIALSHLDPGIYLECPASLRTTYRSFECYIPLDVGYLLLTLPITLWIDSNGVESRRQLSL